MMRSEVRYCLRSSALKNNNPRFPVLAAQTLLVLVALQFPATGYCDSGSSWFNNLFESKGRNMKQVATKVATLNEDDEIWGLDFSPDGKYLAATSPNSLKVHVWDWRNGKIASSLEKVSGGGDMDSTEPIRFSPDGKLLAASHTRAINNIVTRIWNTDTWAVVHDIDEPIIGGCCNSIGFTPNGNFLIRVQSRINNTNANSLTVYDTHTWQTVWGLSTEPFKPTSLSISPDGEFVAMGGNAFGKDTYDAQIMIVDMAHRTIVKTIQAFPNPIQLGVNMHRLAWSADGFQIAAGVGIKTDGADGIRIFDARTGEQVGNEPVPMGTHIRALRYTPDGKYLLEAGIDHSLKIWDGQHRHLLQEISEDGEVGSIAVSADGHHFAVGMLTDKKVQVWEIK